MGQFLFYYQRPEPATWVFMSSFLIIAIFFMFHRLWSIRNLDIFLILLLTPGLMMVYEGRKSRSQESLQSNSTSPVKTASSTLAPAETQEAAPSRPPDNPPDKPVDSKIDPTKLQFWGFAWLLTICGLWLTRLLLDTTMVRRPLLEPNLSSGGIMFIGVSLFLFLMANVVNSPPVLESRSGGKPGPGYELLKLLPDIQTAPDPEAIAKRSMLIGMVGPNDKSQAPADEVHSDAEIAAISKSASKDIVVQSAATSITIPSPKRVRLSRIFLIVANLVLVLSIVAVGYWHFDNFKTGVGVATLFLLLPYTAQMTGRVDHLIPGALIAVAITLYRQPIASGIMLGLASGLVFYPFFLFPLWISFYWQRGAYRFTSGFLGSIVALVIALGLVTTSASTATGFADRLGQMFGTIPFALKDLDGIWGLGWHPYFRIPVMVAFVLISFSFIMWPAQKSLATLLSCTAALMTAAQFCYAYGGGLYMAWFIPCALLTVYRPNLDDCIALEVVRGFGRNRSKPRSPTNEEPKNYAAAS